MYRGYTVWSWLLEALKELEEKRKEGEKLGLEEEEEEEKEKLET